MTNPLPSPTHTTSAGVLGLVEDRWARMQASTLTLQSYVRMLRVRRSYTALRAASLLLQSAQRARAARIAYGVELKEYKAARSIQSSWRGHKDRSEYVRVRK